MNLSNLYGVARASMTNSLLIRNTHVLTLDDADHEWLRAGIVIESGEIKAVGPGVGVRTANASARGAPVFT